MKNTFAVSMTLLVALTLGGSIFAYNKGTSAHHAAEKHSESGESHGGEKEGAATTGEQGEAAETEQSSAESGTEPSTETGMASEAEMGAGGEAGEDTAPADTAENPAEATEPGGGAAVGGETGQQPVETAAAAEEQGDVNAGEPLYAANCAGCHGAQGQGGIGPALAKVKEWSNSQFLTTLREGQTPERSLNTIMPRYPTAQLTDSDVVNVFAYVKSLN